MYQFFVEPEQIDVAGKSVIIRGNDVNHIKNVLRMRPGEEVAVSNGIDGREYRCGILALEEDCVRLELRFIKEDGVELPAKIYLFQGLPKADKMELIIQKVTAVMLSHLFPITKYSTVMGSSLKSKQDPFSLPVLWNQEMAPVSADHLVEGFVKVMKRGFLTGMRQTYRLQCVFRIFRCH